MYRLLGQNGEVRERRRQLRHPVYQKPELLAEKPNEVWSWDITKLMGPTKWSYRAGPARLNSFPRTISGFLPGSSQNAVFAAAQEGRSPTGDAANTAAENSCRHRQG